MNPGKVIKKRIDDGVKTICSKCLKEVKTPDGGFTKCCSAISLSPIQMAKAIKGHIPKINGNVVAGTSVSKKKRSKRDAVSGLRMGTTKHKCYLLWLKNPDKHYKEIAAKLGANESSVRSWIGRFRKKHEN